LRPYLSDNLPIYGLGRINVITPIVVKTPIRNMESVKASKKGWNTVTYILDPKPSNKIRVYQLGGLESNDNLSFLINKEVKE